MNWHRLGQKLIPLLVIVMALISACGAPEQASVAAPEAAASVQVALDLPKVIDVATVEQVRARDDVVLLDVREDFEFESGHIPGAQWIPLGDLPSRLDEIPQDKTVIAVCRSGNRSGQATDFLLDQGFDVHNMNGGMNAWTAAGYAVE